jgi:hypothetical protein
MSLLNLIPKLKERKIDCKKENEHIVVHLQGDPLVRAMSASSNEIKIVQLPWPFDCTASMAVR